MLSPHRLSPADLDALAAKVAERLSSDIADRVADRLLTASEARVRAAAIVGDDALVDEDEAASILASRPKTLQHWRLRGEGPRVVRISANRVAYRIGDLRSFIAEAGRSQRPGSRIALATAS